MTTPPLYDKYTPRKRADYVFVDPEQQRRVEEWLTRGELPNHMLFVGGPGVGKTSLAWMLLSEFGVDADDIYYKNVSLHNSVDLIRSEIEPFCDGAGWGVVRYLLLDEADNYREDAQKMLRGVINDYGTQVRFIFTANYERRILDPIRSRVHVERFGGLDEEQFIVKMAEIAQTEIRADLNDDDIAALESIKNLYYPDLRKSLVVLEDCMRGGRVLAPTSREAKSDNDWERNLVILVKNKASVAELKEFASSLRVDEMERVYELLYTYSGKLFGDAEGDAVRIINVMMDRASRAAFPVITLTACLIELIELVG